MLRRTVILSSLFAMASAGCSFDNGGLPFVGDGGGDPADAAQFDSGGADFDAASGIDAPQGAFDASPFDAAVSFDAQVFDAQVFDATPPPDAECMCDDFVDCTDNVCDMNGCSFPDICPANSTCNLISGLCDGVLTFQQGVNGYAATRDTFLSEANPDTNNAEAEALEWDADDPFNSNQMTASLLVFNQIFGTGASQIPQGATVNSATLTLTVLNGSNGTAGEIRESLVAWGESTVTWNSFGGEPGIQANEVGPVVAAAPTGPCGGPCTDITADVDVQASLQAWSNNTASMHGWMFIPTATDGFDVASSEAAAADARPLLTVDFSFPAQ